MKRYPDRVEARVPVVVGSVDARGRPVSMSGRALNTGSAAAQALLRWAYCGARPDTAPETVTVAFLEESEGRLDVEYLAIGASSSRWRLLRRRPAGDAQGALEHATRCVHGMLEATALLLAAGCARWSECEDSDFVDLVLEGKHVRRFPAAVRTALHDEALVELVRDTLAPFGDLEVAQMILGHDPESPGRYVETVVAGSPRLDRFVRGESLRSLLDEASRP